MKIFHRSRAHWCQILLTLLLVLTLLPTHAETKTERDTRMAWWREAKLGMFIHWGVYSVPAGFYQGKPVKGIGEWIMNRGKIPVADYKAFASDFTASDFNAEEWVLLAKQAGMKYIVITSKHHDGFAMFDTKASDWNIVQATPFKRDPLKELAAACRKHGMKLGFYYSQDQDWCNGGSVIGKKWDKAQDHDMNNYINQIAVPQVKEILGNYGEFPAVLWWDTPHAITPAQAHKLDQIVHELKPNIIMNNRLGGGIKGDTETPEQYIPVNGFPGKDWETCMTMNGTWGFKSNDHKWKSTQTLIKNVCEILSKGGNFLLNVGPTSEGVIPYQSRMRLRQVGAWVAKNQEAVYGTQAGPFLAASDWGFASSKNGLLYLYITKWPANNQLVVPLENPSGEAWPLLNSQQKLTVTRGKHSLSVDVSKVSEEDYATVLVLDLHAKTLPAPIPPKPALAQSADGRVVLTSSDAQIIGERLNNSTMEDITALRFWEKASDYASWKFLVHQPGTFSVKARYAVSPNHAGSTFAIRVGGQKLTQVLESTDGWENYRDLDMGRVTINKSGTSTVRAELVKLAAGAGLNLQSVTLTPVR